MCPLCHVDRTEGRKEGELELSTKSAAEAGSEQNKNLDLVGDRF